ncbi:hypothetical protein [Candidatus Leptofilum sp.]
MKRLFVIMIALLLTGLTACDQTTEAEQTAVVSEPGVVTVFKSPT